MTKLDYEPKRPKRRPYWMPRPGELRALGWLAIKFTLCVWAGTAAIALIAAIVHGVRWLLSN